MKKIFCLPFALFAMLLMFCTVTASAADRTISVTDYQAETGTRYIRICVNGQNLTFLSSDTYGLPFIDSQNRLQIPVRKFAEAIGGTVEYHDGDKSVTITGLDSTVVFHMGSNTMLCNGSAIEMDTTAQNIEGRTYIPLRAISEALGYTVEYTSEKASAAEYCISYEDVVLAERGKQNYIGVHDISSIPEPPPLTAEELNVVVELYNQMCMFSPRYEVDSFDTVGSYRDWIYITLDDGSKLQLCRRGQDEWEVRCFLWMDSQNKWDGFVMHSSELYTYIARLYNPEWTPQ